MDCPACHHPNAEGVRFCAKCGAPLPAASSEADPLIGTVVGGRFRIVGILGEGGMGRVYSAEQQMGTSVRKVAVKTLLAQFARDPQTVARFMREVGTVSELEHPNTIRVYDFGQTPTGELYIAMELLTGTSLEALLEKEHRLSPERVEKIMGQICGSLQEAHEKGIVHRDLKPANVQLMQRAGEDDYCKVLDFGIAKRAETKDSKAEQKLTQQGTILGTPPYMSPEQFTGKELDARSDIYSLGVMLYEMLTGRLPFEADTPWQWATQHMTAQPYSFEATQIGNQVPPKMRAAILKALEKDREKRHQSVRELFEALSLGGQRLSMLGPMPSSVMAAVAGSAPVTSTGGHRGGQTQVGEPLFAGAPSAAMGSGKTVMEALPPTAPSPHMGHVPTAGGQAIPAAPIHSQPSKNNTAVIAAVLAVVGVIGLVIAVVTLRGSGGNAADPEVILISSAPSAVVTSDPPPELPPEADPSGKPAASAATTAATTQTTKTTTTAAPQNSAAAADAKADAACEAAYGLALGNNVSLAVSNYRNCKGAKQSKALSAIDSASLREVKSKGCGAKSTALQAAAIGASSGRNALPASCKK